MDLAGWLDYQQRVHPRAIELGLDRVRAVWQRLGAPRPAPTVVTVGGTNGKGSTCAMLESIYRCAGFATGLYASQSSPSRRYARSGSELDRRRRQPPNDETLTKRLPQWWESLPLLGRTLPSCTPSNDGQAGDGCSGEPDG